MINVREIITEITDRWFLREPFLFAVYCTHNLVENNEMDCCIRSGKKRIEYNSKMLEVHNRNEIAEYMKREILRIVLKHPYQRQPICASPSVIYLASNLTLYQSGATGINPMKIKDYKKLMNLLQNVELSFEEMYKFLINLSGVDDMNTHSNNDSTNAQSQLGEGVGDNDNDAGESDGKGSNDYQAELNQNSNGDNKTCEDKGTCDKSNDQGQNEDDSLIFPFNGNEIIGQCADV